MASALAFWDLINTTEQEGPLYSVLLEVPTEKPFLYIFSSSCFFQYKLAKCYHSFNVNPLEHSGTSSNYESRDR